MGTEVDNYSVITINDKKPCLCNNTLDKIFLLSCQEAITYFVCKEDRCTKGTDYAKCHRLDVNDNQGSEWSLWWLRSIYNNGYDASGVFIEGGIFTWDISGITIGIRPACWIKLDK